MDYGRYAGLVLCLSMACGPAVDEQGDTQADESDGTGGAASSTGHSSDNGTSDDESAGDETSAQTGATTASDTAPEDPRECSVLPDQSGDAATVVLRNEAPFTVFFGRDAGCEFEPFDLFDAAGTPMQWHRSSCENTCEAIAKGECVFCGSCAGPTFVRLDPGASFPVAWDHVMVETVPVPASCEDACEPTCGRVTPIAPGDYAFALTVRDFCSEDPDDPACACPNGEDACTVTLEEAAPMSSISFNTTVTLPTDTIELVFE